MSKLANRVKVTTSTIGSGSPITLGNPEDGFFDFTEAGISCLLYTSPSPRD